MPTATDGVSRMGARAVLMGTHDGAVDHRVFVVGISGEMLEHLLPELPSFAANRRAATGTICVGELRPDRWMERRERRRLWRIGALRLASRDRIRAD